MFNYINKAVGGPCGGVVTAEVVEFCKTVLVNQKLIDSPFVKRSDIVTSVIKATANRIYL